MRFLSRHVPRWAASELMAMTSEAEAPWTLAIPAHRTTVPQATAHTDPADIPVAA